MRTKGVVEGLVGLAFVAAALGLAAWLLDLGDLARGALVSVPWPEVILGALCLLWLLVLLKAPWDLYFQAHAVLDEMARSRETGITIDAAREAYVRRTRRRLLGVALLAHAASAALAAGIALWGGGAVGWWFAAFYLVSTAFRPLVSAYRHLMRRLRQLFDEARFPREDVLAMKARVESHESTLPELRRRLDGAEKALAEERAAREAEAKELRGHVHQTARELEKSLAKLTDNQEVVKGIQAFVRLVSNASRS